MPFDGMHELIVRFTISNEEGGFELRMKQGICPLSLPKGQELVFWC